MMALSCCRSGFVSRVRIMIACVADLYHSCRLCWHRSCWNFWRLKYSLTSPCSSLSLARGSACSQTPCRVHRIGRSSAPAASITEACPAKKWSDSSNQSCIRPHWRRSACRTEVPVATHICFHQRYRHHRADDAAEDIAAGIAPADAGHRAKVQNAHWNYLMLDGSLRVDSRRRSWAADLRSTRCKSRWTCLLVQVARVLNS